MHAAAILAFSLWLGGEPVSFDRDDKPRFTPAQIAHTSIHTRVGLARWASTGQGRSLLEYFRSLGCAIVVIENAQEDGIGRAPQPGLATLVAAGRGNGRQIYQLILNPRTFQVPTDMQFGRQPSTPADLMTVAWAAEMLHIYFYSQGISLPHHQRDDFQDEWHAVAGELGMPGLAHGGDEASLER